MMRTREISLIRRKNVERTTVTGIPDVKRGTGVGAFENQEGNPLGASGIQTRPSLSAPSPG